VVKVRHSFAYSRLSDGIKTYSEQLGDKDDVEATHAEVRKAKRIVFLGFAFHDQNLALLKPKGPLTVKDIYATAFNMSRSDADVVNAQLLDFFEGHQRDMKATLDIAPRRAAVILTTKTGLAFKKRYFR
jgi:hypothetical protein